MSKAKAGTASARRDRDTGAAHLPSVPKAGPAPASRGRITPPPILKGDRPAQRRFHAIYESAPWLGEADGLFVGTLLWLQSTLEAEAVRLAEGKVKLTTQGDAGRAYLSPEVRFIFEALREVRATAELLALPVADRARLGLNQAHATSILEQIRRARLDDAVKARAEAVLDV